MLRSAPGRVTEGAGWGDGVFVAAPNALVCR